MGIRTIVTVLFLAFGLERPGFAETVPETGTVTPAAADAAGGNGNNGMVLAQAVSREDVTQLRRDLNALAQSMQVVDGSAPLTAPVADGTNPNAAPPQPAAPAYAPAVADS